MNTWIADSVSLLSSLASFLTSPAIFNIVGCFLLIPIVKAFKTLVGG